MEPDYEALASLFPNIAAQLRSGLSNFYLAAAHLAPPEMREMDPELDAMDKLAYLNRELFAMIDGGVSMDLLARLLSTQLLARGEKHLLDRNRTYFKLLRRIAGEGQRTGQLRTDRTANDIVKAYALWERALLYDWCLCGGEYSLVAYTDSMTPMFLESYRAQ